jgi:hypothetical protein
MLKTRGWMSTKYDAADGATHAHELGSITRSMNDAIAEARYSVIESPLIFPSLLQLGG